VDGKIQKFKKGAFHIAIKGGVPICPVVVSGAHELLPKGKLIPRPGVLKLKFLPPVETVDWNLDDLDLHVEEVRMLMIVALEKLSKRAA